MKFSDIIDQASELLKTYFEIPPEDDERKRCEKVTGKVLERQTV